MGQIPKASGCEKGTGATVPSPSCSTHLISRPSTALQAAAVLPLLIPRQKNSPTAIFAVGLYPFALSRGYERHHFFSAYISRTTGNTDQALGQPA